MTKWFSDWTKRYVFADLAFSSGLNSPESRSLLIVIVTIACSICFFFFASLRSNYMQKKLGILVKKKKSRHGISCIYIFFCVIYYLKYYINFDMYFFIYTILTYLCIYFVFILFFILCYVFYHILIFFISYLYHIIILYLILSHLIWITHNVNLCSLHV